MSAARESFINLEPTPEQKDKVFEICAAFLSELMTKVGAGIRMDLNHEKEYGFKMPDLVVEVDQKGEKISLYPGNFTFCNIIDSDYVTIDMELAQKNKEVYGHWNIIKDINNVPLDKGLLICDEYSFYSGKFVKSNGKIIAVTVTCDEDIYTIHKIKNPYAWSETPVKPHGLVQSVPEIYKTFIDPNHGEQIIIKPIETAQKKLSKAEKKKLRKMKKLKH